MSLEVNIQKHFPTFTLDVNFQAGAETLGFLGASGCGKSLTLRCIAGIEMPDVGRIVVNDRVFFERVAGEKPTVNLTPQERKTALLFQNYMLFPNLTVEENVAAGIPKKTAASERAEIVEAQLHRFGLGSMKERYPAQLSGGQQQRVALARMLTARPGILMLDEPFSALDAHLKSALEQNLIGLFDEFEGTVLYVSHDIDEAFRFCDRIAVVEDGHINEIAPTQNIVSHPQSLAAIKLSGCKNTTCAKRVDAHTVFLPDWGIELTTTQEVPEEVRFFGVRAFYLRRATEPGKNVFRMRADRVSDSRFERTVMLSFLDAQVPDADDAEDTAGNAAANAAMDAAENAAVDQSMKFLKTHVQWKVDKLAVSPDDLPERGDELLIEIPSQNMYLVEK